MCILTDLMVENEIQASGFSNSNSHTIVCLLLQEEQRNKNYAEDLKIELLKNSLIRFYLVGLCVFDSMRMASSRQN